MEPLKGPAVTAYVGIGSNMGKRLGNIRMAVAGMRQVPGLAVARLSSIYETEPVGQAGQPAFLNAVAEVETTLTPDELLTTLLRIEHHLGRTRRHKWEPRVIDLDILYYGRQVVDRADLKVPHPERVRRAFVLVPLAELAPQLDDPVEGRTVGQMLERLDRTGQSVTRIQTSKF
jgi:2-amino-4-hydroxy-6-hydroxymethyldihydropteridine diphosphokinase